MKTHCHFENWEKFCRQTIGNKYLPPETKREKQEAQETGPAAGKAQAKADDIPKE